MDNLFKSKGISNSMKTVHTNKKNREEEFRSTSPFIHDPSQLAIIIDVFY